MTEELRQGFINHAHNFGGLLSVPTFSIDGNIDSHDLTDVDAPTTLPMSGKCDRAFYSLAGNIN